MKCQFQNRLKVKEAGSSLPKAGKGSTWRICCFWNAASQADSRTLLLEALLTTERFNCSMRPAPQPPPQLGVASCWLVKLVEWVLSLCTTHLSLSQILHLTLLLLTLHCEPMAPCFLFSLFYGFKMALWSMDSLPES